MLPSAEFCYLYVRIVIIISLYIFLFVMPRGEWNVRVYGQI